MWETVLTATKVMGMWFIGLIVVWTFVKVAFGAFYKAKEEHNNRRKEDG